jgi:phage shock protein A
MFKRIGNLFRGFLSLFMTGLERQNPEALLEVEKENLRTQIARYTQGLSVITKRADRSVAATHSFAG